MKSVRIGGEKFSKTLSLPVQTWANLETIRKLSHWPDLSITIQDCIDSKLVSLKIVEKLNHTKIGDDIEQK